MLYSSGGAPKPGADQATAIDIDDDGPAVVAGTIQRDTPRLSLSDFNTLFDLSDSKTTADLIQDVTTTRAAHVKVKTAEDLKRGGPPVLRPPAAPKLPPASRKKKAPAKVNDEDDWEDEDVDVDAPPPKRRAGLRASARTRKAVVDLPSDPEDDESDSDSDPDEVAKLRAEVVRLEAINKKLNAREAPAPMEMDQAPGAPRRPRRRRRPPRR